MRIPWKEPRSRISPKRGTRGKGGYDPSHTIAGDQSIRRDREKKEEGLREFTCKDLDPEYSSWKILLPIA